MKKGHARAETIRPGSHRLSGNPCHPAGMSGHEAHAQPDGDDGPQHRRRDTGVDAEHPGTESHDVPCSHGDTEGDSHCHVHGDAGQFADLRANRKSAADGRLAPIQLQDSQALQSALSEGELACIGDVPETLARVALAWPAQESKDELFRLIGCLRDETLARLFLAGLVTGPEPISPETSDCVRAVFAVIDPQEVMTAGIEDNPESAGRAMAASTAAATTVTACLTDEEWERATSGIERGPQGRAEKRCLMEVLGGPGEMAETMRAAREGDSAGLTEAAAACGVDRDPATDQGPADPPTTSTVTVETLTTALSTPAPAPVITTIILVAPVPPDIPEYDHSQCKHWGDADGDCSSAEA